MSIEDPIQEAAHVAARGEGALVAKNMAYLAGAQVMTIPLSAITNVMMLRYLGAADFGLLSIAGTMCAFGVLVVEWGQQSVLPALIARDRPRAAALLGTAFAWRALSSLGVYLFLAGLSLVLGYDSIYQWILLMVFLGALMNSLAGGYKDSIRGFERTDIPAIAHVAQQTLLFAVAASVMLIGGRLHALLYVGVLVPMVTIMWLSHASKGVGIGRLQVRKKDFAVLLLMGTPFIFNDIARTLQPMIDMLFLSRLTTDETVGWFAAARRLVGLLILPATTLTGSLYPTLCRLWTDNKAGFAATVRGSLNGISLVAAPAALGCALFPEIGVSVLSKAYSPAADNLRVMALFVFLVYYSMPVGTAVLAAGKQRAWTLLQIPCIVVSVGLDPLLVPWFQQHMGNGGIGLGVASVVGETMVVGGGLLLMPRHVLDRSVWRTVLLTTVSGAAMAAVAFALKGMVTPFIAAPIAVGAYLLAALATGAITKSQRDAVLGVLRRKLGRFVKF